MAEPGGTPATMSFVQDLHRALQHLYDAAELSQSLLLGHFGLIHQNAPAASLRRVLVEAVESLKPGLDVPPDAKDWRAYRVLFHRYVEQFTQQQVAGALALSIRQLRRDEKAGVRRLADHLWIHYGLDGGVPKPGTPQSESGGGAVNAGARTSSRQRELAWVRNSFPTEPTDVGELIQAALATVELLIQSCEVRLHIKLDDPLPRPSVQPASVRQALLNILTVAVRSVPQGRLDIGAFARPGGVCITIQPKGHQVVPPPLGHDELERLEMARDLVGLSGGSLEMVAGEPSDGPFVARLVLPTSEKEAVLVIDDNADTLRLLRRYLAGTRYAFMGARNAEEALEMAAKTSPRLIVLDIMLPGIDGWRLLGRLREHPKTCGASIIVYSILPQEHLALALGAAAFLHKPVSRQALLSALDGRIRPERRERQ